MRPRYIVLVAVCVLARLHSSSVAFARDRSFTAVLHGLKQDYDVTPKSVPGLWLVKCIMKVVPEASGTSRLDLVLLEEKDLRKIAAARDLNTRLQKALGSAWSPIVQVDSSKDQERVLIFARPHNHRMDLIIVACDGDEGVAMFLRVDPEKMKDVIDHPGSLPNHT